MRALALATMLAALTWGCATPPDTITMQTVELPNLTLTIIESFETGGGAIAPEPFEDHWGEHAGSTDGRIGSAAGRDGGSGALAYDYSARFNGAYDPVAFADTDVVFSVTWTMPAAGDADGITLSVNPGRVSTVFVRVRNADPSNWVANGVRLTIPQNDWTRLVLPYSLFPRDETGARVNLSRPYLVEIGFSYAENAAIHALDYADEVSGRVLIDDVGFYHREADGQPGAIATFDDEERGVAITAELYESSVYVDYAASDTGVPHRTPGVDGLAITRARTEGASGDGERIDMRLVVNDAFQAYLDQGRQLVLSGVIQIPLPDEGRELLFSVRSDTLPAGDLDIYSDPDYGHYVGFDVGDRWRDVVVPLDPGRAPDTHAAIYYRFPVPWELMSTVVRTGGLSVDVSFDEFRVR